MEKYFNLIPGQPHFEAFDLAIKEFLLGFEFRAKKMGCIYGILVYKTSDNIKLEGKIHAFAGRTTPIMKASAFFIGEGEFGKITGILPKSGDDSIVLANDGKSNKLIVVRGCDFDEEKFLENFSEMKRTQLEAEREKTIANALKKGGGGSTNVEGLVGYLRKIEANHNQHMKWEADRKRSSNKSRISA